MYDLLPERPIDAAEIEQLLDLTFGPARHRKTAQHLRHGRAPLPGLSFVLRDGDLLAASIRHWPLSLANDQPALLLGPLAVRPDHRGRGCGGALIRHGLAAAGAAGHGAVLLIGDAGYYGRFGFSADLTAGLSLPGPVAASRFLGLELTPGILAGASGPVGPARCLRAA
ncbi:MAG: N-acetyltransferase [Alphaproteobacteria bacterium]|jgi:predicted N-acetyltransferase YhbS|nr:N-acetyltransferase [Alphaproteobacteria bacterium]MDP6564552.1 N-acetyltransferase [Alphaproteobacteria bacterium]MDP6811910.1 N-acetyltransferase [Alphaproteobacteria bacterium]